MKKLFFFTAITFLTLSSCRKEATTLSQGQTVAESQLQTNASSSQSQTNANRNGGAFTFSDVFTIDLAGEQFYNSCTNEQMTASIWNVLVSFHGIYNGNKSTIIIHSGTQRFKGVGEESGLEYIGAASRNYQESSFSDGVFTTKLVYVIHAMTAGGGNNLIITETFYINVDASGNVTYQRDPVYEVRCQ